MTTLSTLADVALAPRNFLELLYQAAVTRALPLHNTAAFLPPPPSRESGGRTIVLGAGKAGGSMAQAVEALWPADAPLEGLVVTRYHHIPPRPAGLVQRIELVEAAHPVPDTAGLHAAQRIMAMTQGLTQNDLVLCLISGGGSSLAHLARRRHDRWTTSSAVNQALLDSGASIGEMNCVRKHLSRIKGGRLGCGLRTGACADPDLISDVPGDEPKCDCQRPHRARCHHLCRCAGDSEALQDHGAACHCKRPICLQSGALESRETGRCGVCPPCEVAHDCHTTTVAGSRGG